MEPTEIQEGLYDIPYHYLPTKERKDVWRVARYLYWGYEYLAVLDAVLSLVVSYQPKRLLDFGCGDGRLIRELVNNYSEVEAIGIDSSQRALLFANALLYNVSNVSFFQKLSDIDSKLLPVDMIVAMEVLEHIRPAEVKSVINDFRYALNPDGFLIVTVPTTNTPVHKKHYQHFSIESFKMITSEAFVCVDYKYLHQSGKMWELVRRMIANRIFIANSKLLLHLTTYVYMKWVMNATSEKGTHMVITLKPTKS
jgi:2-polyprenyl-3-methyl-5-hydroxy-6-metoxy-1,4-benzoquinol methylase